MCSICVVVTKIFLYTNKHMHLDMRRNMECTGADINYK